MSSVFLLFGDWECRELVLPLFNIHRISVKNISEFLGAFCKIGFMIESVTYNFKH